MKKIVSLILCAVMLLSLAGCGEEARLYEKYADIITMMEAEDYTGVMAVVSAKLVEQQNEGKERPELVKVMEGDWFLTSSDYVSAPEQFNLRQDGTCTVSGKEMLWLERGSGDTDFNGVIMDSGEYKYCFNFRMDAENLSMPYVELWTCQVDGESVYSDKHVGSYRNHPQYTMVTKWWRILDGDEGMDDGFDIYSGNIWYNEVDYQWKITSAANEMPVVITAVADNGTDATLSFSLEERDGHYVMNVVDDATGNSALYYHEEYGYEASWPEYNYPKVIKQLKNHLKGYSLWIEELEKSLSNNEAREYLYQQFVKLGDYKDVQDYIARFTIVPSMLSKVVQQTTDQLGNVSNSTQATYFYDETGRMIQGDGAEMIEKFGIYEDWNDFFLEYDAAGKVSGIKISNNPVTAVCTPTYNAAGQLETMQVQRTDRQYTSTFTYDDQGRLIQLDLPYGGTDDYNNYVYTYTYDEAGHMTQKIKTRYKGYYQYVYDYTYEGDVVTQVVESYLYRDKLDYTVTYVYTNDAQGRPISATVTTTQSSATYAAREIVYQYNDLYFIDSTGIELEEN